MSNLKITILVFFTAFLSLSYSSFSQAKQNKDGEEYFDGGVSNPKPLTPSSKEAARKKVVYILKYNNKGLLTGNACVKEETVKMGFEYMEVCNPNASNFFNRVWVGMYNFGTNVKLTFKNGPGWKGRLKKKIAACRRNSGDFVW